MAQSWKTLLLVVIGAAIFGWVTVRILGGERREPVAVQTAALESPAPPPAPTTTAVATTAPALPAPSPAAAAPIEPPTPDGDESDVIARELELLAQVLVTDQRIADMIMPRVNDVLDVPGTAQYRRAPDFWEPALAPADEEETTP